MGSHNVTYTDHQGNELNIEVYEDASAWIATRFNENQMSLGVVIPAGQREPLARALAGWHSGVISADAMNQDLVRILDALGLGDHARPYSAHECVTRDVLPAIYTLRRALGSDVPQPDHPVPVDPASAERAWDEGYSAGIVSEPGGGDKNPYREPEVDEAAVEALAKALHATAHDGTRWDRPPTRDGWRERARVLIRDHGVQVGVPNAE